MSDTMKKRWISLYVENEVGVLAKISGLFSGKSYNLKSLTVGETEDPTVSRMTISPIHKKEILFIKIHSLKKDEVEDVFRSAEVFGVSVSDYGRNSVILESVKTESENDDILKFYKKYYLSRMEAVRGGSVAVESVSKSER